MTGTGGLKRVSPDFVNDCYLHIPPIEEQIEIAEYLDSKCSEMDTLIEKKTALLEEMETYKKSVIYEYVTGKKEV
jgi:type I restriction enzyme S subunit